MASAASSSSPPASAFLLTHSPSPATPHTADFDELQQLHAEAAAHSPDGSAGHHSDAASPDPHSGGGGDGDGYADADADEADHSARYAPSMHQAGVHVDFSSPHGYPMGFGQQSLPHAHGHAYLSQPQHFALHGGAAHIPPASAFLAQSFSAAPPGRFGGAGGGGGGGGGGSAPPPCRMYAAAGFCKWGDSCRFLHVDGGGGPGAPQQRPMHAPPGLTGSAGYHMQHQPHHVHAALVQQQLDALHAQQQHQQHQVQHSHPALHSLPHARTPPSFYQSQGGADELPQGDNDIRGDDGRPPAGGAAEDRGEGAKAQPDGADVAAADDDESGEGSTPKSAAPSSLASTRVSSSSSSPSTLSAHATPFSSSFSSPAFSSFPGPSGLHQSPFIPPPQQLHYPPPFYPKGPYPGIPGSLHLHPPSLASFGQSHAPPHHPSSVSSSPLQRDPAREAELFGDTSTGINFDRYDEIQVDVQGHDVPPPIAAFDDLTFPATLQHNIALAHYTKPTPVQKNALPMALQGRDIMACAQTGSGKARRALSHTASPAVPRSASDLRLPPPACAYVLVCGCSVLLRRRRPPPSCSRSSRCCCPTGWARGR